MPAKSKPSRQLAAILFADIVGYTALMQKGEDNAMSILARYESVLQEKVSFYNGEIIKKYGDGSLILFDSTVDAVQCAQKIQLDLREDPIVPLRIGIHVGEVIHKGTDVFGNGVNIASRIESMGIAGAILFSKNVQEKIKNQETLLTQSLGPFEFKNVDEPIEIFALSNNDFSIPTLEQIRGKGKFKNDKSKFLSWPMGILSFIILALLFNQFIKPNNINKSMSSGAVQQSSLIGVLPFSNSKPDTGTDYFGFAIADQIIGDLSYNKNITVRPSSAIRKYENEIVDTKIAAKELDVNYILTGYFLKEGDFIRLNVELVDIRTNELKWRDQIQVKFINAFDLQDIVAKNVVESIDRQFTQEEMERIKRDVPADPLAYEYYLRGLSFPLTNEDNQLAIDMLKKSIELDSTYAPAYAELGDRVHRVAILGEFNVEKFNSAEGILLKALEINSDLISAQAKLAMFYAETSRIEDATEIALRILDLNPNNADALFALGYCYRYAGFDQESALQMEKAITNDPKNPRFRSLSLTYFNLQEYDKALNVFDRLEDSHWVTGMRGLIYTKQSKEDKALELFNQIIAKEPDSFWGLISKTYIAYIQKDTLAGLQALEARKSANIIDPEPLFYTACEYASFAEKDECLNHLSKAINGGYFNYPLMQKEKSLDLVRDEPVFKHILEIAKTKHENFKKRFFEM